MMSTGPSSLNILAAALVAALHSAPAPAAAQDARAMSAAEDLLARRASPAEVVRMLASDFRLRDREVASVLRAVRMSAGAAASGLASGMRLTPERTIAVLLAARYSRVAVMQAATRTLRLDPVRAASAFRAARISASNTAAALERHVDGAGDVTRVLREAGYAAGSTAGALAARRVRDADAGAHLRRAGYRGQEVAPALMRAYRLDGRATAVRMRQAGYPAAEAAAGLARILGDASDVVTSLSLADYDPTDVRRAAVNVLRFPPEEWVIAMKEGGATVLEAAEVLKEDYGMGPVEAGPIILHEAQYTIGNFALALRLVWELDVFEAFDTFREISSASAGRWRALEQGGYDAAPVQMRAYRIPDYRPGRSGEWLENLGVVDPSKVGPIQPEDSDGRVEVLVTRPGLEGFEATLSGRAGQIVGRRPGVFQASGNTYDGEWLEIEFRDFSSGPLELRWLDMRTSMNALAFGYHLMDGELIRGPIESMSIEIGDPAGEGRATIESGTHAGIPFTGSTVPFDVPTHREGGVEADLVSLSSNAVTVETTAAGSGTVQVRIEIGFDESGGEVEGTFLEYIPCWTCGTFQVPLSECSGLDLACFLNVLGTATSSLGSCLDLSNWQEQEVAAGPSVPFEANLTSPNLEVAITIGPDGTGGYTALSVLPTFSAGISLRSGQGDVSLQPIEDWILGQVNHRLLGAIEDMDLGTILVEGLEQARATLGWGHIRGVYVLQDGRWFMDASY